MKGYTGRRLKTHRLSKLLCQAQEERKLLKICFLAMLAMDAQRDFAEGRSAGPLHFVETAEQNLCFTWVTRLRVYTASPLGHRKCTSRSYIGRVPALSRSIRDERARLAVREASSCVRVSRVKRTARQIKERFHEETIDRSEVYKMFEMFGSNFDDRIIEGERTLYFIRRTHIYSLFFKDKLIK